MTAYLDRLLNERTSLTGVMAGLRDRAATEERDLTDTERSECTRLQERCAEIDGQLTEHETQAASARAFAELTAKIDATREPVAGHAVTTRQAPIDATTWGERFVASDSFRSYRGHGKSEPVELERYLDERAAITTANLSIPPFVWTPQEQVSRAPLLELVNRVAVSSGTVEWVVIGPDPIAAVVAEGALKPEATLSFTPATAALDTLAHFVQITRQALEDASYIRSLIEGKLRRGLLAKVEADVATMLGASTAIQTASTSAAAGGDMLASVRAGIGKVESAGYRPNAIVLNPADYAGMDITTMQETNQGPTKYGSYWGLPIVSSSAIVAGNAYVGDFAEGLTLFDRGVTSVFMSDSHADNFLRNILVILAEARVKAAITDPLALCECTVAA